MAKIYLVGGAVRDHLLGIQSRDRDYVVVGATPTDMINDGFSQVGASFPVFLHPVTGEEYALARTERKNGVGYHGFETFYDTSVTLVDDLRRRDLTINSMAMDLDSGAIIDPFGGRGDLAKGILRHTSEAFADDPLRILRVARFAARYGFIVHPETIDLGSQLVNELVHLPAERIWTELNKGFSEKSPMLMLKVLYMFGALKVEPLSDYFDSTFSHLQFGVDADVNAMLAMTKLAEHDVQKLQAMKIPTYITTAAQVELRLTKLLTSNSMSATDVHEFLKVVRNDLDSPTFLLAYKVASIKARTEGNAVLFNSNYSVLSKAAVYVRRLDLATLVASVDKQDVKRAVNEAKLNAVSLVVGE